MFVCSLLRTILLLPLLNAIWEVLWWQAATGVMVDLEFGLLNAACLLVSWLDAADADRLFYVEVE